MRNGKYMMSGVGSATMTDDWNGNDIDIDLFCLDGVVYGAYIDPDDGYRSYGVIRPTDYKCQYTFPPQEVIVEEVEERVPHEGCYDYDEHRRFITITDAKNGKLILKVGTDYTDDYYPMAIFSYSPENFEVNQGK